MVGSEPHALLPRGFRYEVHRLVTASDIHLWAGLTGHQMSVHSTSAFTHQAVARHFVAPDAYLIGLIADTALRLAAHVPTLEARLESLHVHFTAPVLLGTALRVAVTVDTWDAAAGVYLLDIRVTCAGTTPAVSGQAWLRPSAPLPAIT
jgi:acyl dehydratase